MPKALRVMTIEDGKPARGDSSSRLGVRVPHDIPVDSGNVVYPGTGGVSVSPSISALPPHRVPKRFRGVVQGASGSDHDAIWSIGDGSFEQGLLTGDLELRPDPRTSRHGFIEPARKMPVDHYRSAIAATRDSWVAVEP